MLASGEDRMFVYSQLQADGDSSYILSQISFDSARLSIHAKAASDRAHVLPSYLTLLARRCSPIAAADEALA